jgi:putative molybdopterin biosynthesis protein
MAGYPTKSIMENVRILEQIEQIKTLADPRRLEILRLLLAGSASLTQLGGILHQHPARIRHHVQKLENAGLVALDQVTVTHGVTEKFYRACGGAFLIQQMVLPKGGSRQTIIFAGSHDFAMEHLTRDLSREINLVSLPIGSLDGLVALRQGLCQCAGSHLLDPDGDYNTSYVRHFFPDQTARMFTLAYREQGLLLSPGNPKGIHALTDLVRPDVTFINRQGGSGTRLWLDQRLKELGILSDQVRGYRDSVRTHTEVAKMILSRQADVGIGLQAAASRFNLAFIPLFNERYDLTFLPEQDDALVPLLDHLQTGSFRNGVAGMSGYETTHTGEQIHI